MKTVSRPSSKTVSRWWGFVAALCGLATLFAFGHFGEPGRGRLAGASVCALVAAARSQWDLKDRDGFWVILIILIIVHALVVFGTPSLGDHYPGILLAPFIVIDLVFMVLIFSSLN